MRRVKQFIFSSACALVVVGCAASDTVPTAPDGPEPAHELLGAKMNSFQPRSADDDFLEISREFPDFSGGYFDTDGVFVVAGTSADFPIATQRRIATTIGTRIGLNIASFKYAQKRFSFAALYGYRTTLMNSVDFAPLYWSIGVDAAAGNIHVSTETSGRAQQILTVLRDLQVPEEAVSIQVSPPPRTGTSLRSTIRGFVGGIMISPWFYESDGYCSLGEQAFKKDASGYPDASQGRFVFTASHCTLNQGIVTGQTMGQPTTASGTAMTEVADAALFTGSPCPVLKTCQYADVAAMKVDDSISVSYQYAALSNTASPPGYLGTVSLSAPLLSVVHGMTVRHVGAKSGQRDGPVDLPCDNVVVGAYMILCSVKVTAYSDGGDSGGIVYLPYRSDAPGSPWSLGGYHSYTSTTHTSYWYSSNYYIDTALGGAFYFF